MIYFIVTTSIFDDCPVRKAQYTLGIAMLNKTLHDLHIENCKVVVVENNGKRRTLLDELGFEVLYTNNNFLPGSSKGYKELHDILDCIKQYNILDTDFIVKLTGRYILHENSEFMNVIKYIHETKYDCVIRYGPFYRPVNYKMDDCITGLVGMSCRYVKQIENPVGEEPVEWKWGRVTRLIDDSKIHLVGTLGINICPTCNTYFPV